MQKATVENAPVRRRPRRNDEAAPSFPPTRVSEESLLAQFPWWYQVGLWAMSRWWIQLADTETKQALSTASGDALVGNPIFLADHLSRTDLLPMSLAVVRHVANLQELTLPYAAHLDMGRNPVGKVDRSHILKTKLFQRFRQGVDPTSNASLRFNPLHPDVIFPEDAKNDLRSSSGLYFRALVRTFESTVDADIVHLSHPQANRRYFSWMKRLFSATQRGFLVASRAGLAKPDLPLLDEELYEFLQGRRKKTTHTVPYYLIGAYPNPWSYKYPLDRRHRVFVRGPVDLSAEYSGAAEQVEEMIQAMRVAGNVPQPFEYDLVEQK